MSQCQRQRLLRWNAVLPESDVGVAHAAAGDLHHDLVGRRGGEIHVAHLQGLADGDESNRLHRRAS
jgi:hypothetical protein